MKKRTRVLVWVFLVLTSLTTLRFVLTAIKYSLVPAPAGWERTVVLCLVINTSIVTAWVFLLKGRAWAWKALLFLPLAFAAKLIAYQGLYTARAHAITMGALVRAIPMLVIELGLPLLVLLTDRPSGWANPQSVPPDGRDPADGGKIRNPQ